MKYVFARDMFMSVADATLTAQSPSYSTVLNLDRKVREMSFPSSFKPYAIREDGEAEFFSSSLSLRDFYASQHRTVSELTNHVYSLCCVILTNTSSDALPAPQLLCSSDVGPPKQSIAQSFCTLVLDGVSMRFSNHPGICPSI